MVIYQSTEKDIFLNLAKEEFLLTTDNMDFPILMLWQSDSAVVIGKHQNPWQECLVDALKSDGIPLARRISGGGTVYHDLGNLNYSIITSQKDYDADKIYQIILITLQKFGIGGKIENKSNLCVNDLKFSGNAFAFRKKRALHHGTLLVNADLDKLRHYLKPQYKVTESKAISSIPASVINLQSLNPAINIDSLSKAIITNFKKVFAENKKPLILTNKDLDIKKVAKLAEKLKTREWIVEKTPDFMFTENNTEYSFHKGNKI